MTHHQTELDRIARTPEGELAETPFAVLLYALARARRSVALEIRRGPVHKEIFFEDGVPVDCRSNLVHETLSRFMVSTGRLDESEADTAFRESVARSVRFGDVLIEKELVGAEELMKILQQNLAHKLLDGFSWRDGSYRLKSAAPQTDSPLKVNPVQLILIGVGRFATQEQIDASIGPLIGTILAVNPEPAFSVNEIKLTGGHKPLMEALGSRHMRIDELASTTGLSDDDLMRQLYALTLIELVVPADQVPETLPEKKPAAEAKPRPPQRRAETPSPTGAPPSEKSRVSREARDELMEMALNHRRKNPFDLLGVDPDHVTTTAHLRFLEFAEKFAPWIYEKDLANEAQEVFLAGARAYAHLCDPEKRAALIEGYTTAPAPDKPAPTADLFRVKTDLLDSQKQFRQGMALVESGNFRRALEQLEFAADLDPQNAEYQSELAFCRYRIDPDKNAKPALEILSQASRNDPNCGLALFYTGEILRHAGRMDEAEVFLKRALKPMAPDRRPVDALRAINKERKISG